MFCSHSQSIIKGEQKWESKPSHTHRAQKKEPLLYFVISFSNIKQFLWELELL